MTQHELDEDFEFQELVGTNARKTGANRTESLKEHEKKVLEATRKYTSGLSAQAFANAHATAIQRRLSALD